MRSRDAYRYDLIRLPPAEQHAFLTSGFRRSAERRGTSQIEARVVSARQQNVGAGGRRRRAGVGLTWNQLANRRSRRYE